MSEYIECACKILEPNGALINRKDGTPVMLTINSADCLSCGMKWLYNHLLQKWAKAWGPEGRAWIAGYPDVASHEAAQKRAVGA